MNIRLSNEKRNAIINYIVNDVTANSGSEGKIDSIRAKMSAVLAEMYENVEGYKALTSSVKSSVANMWICKTSAVEVSFGKFSETVKDAKTKHMGSAYSKYKQVVKKLESADADIRPDHTFGGKGFVFYSGIYTGRRVLKRFDTRSVTNLVSVENVVEGEYYRDAGKLRVELKAPVYVPIVAMSGRVTLSEEFEAGKDGIFEHKYLSELAAYLVEVKTEELVMLFNRHVLTSKLERAITPMKTLKDLVSYNESFQKYYDHFAAQWEKKKEVGTAISPVSKDELNKLIACAGSSDSICA